MNLTCPNCKKEVKPDDVKWFGQEAREAAVFCCPACHALAELIYQRGKVELSRLLMMLMEGVRVSLAEGRLQLPESPNGEPSKKQVLEAILNMKDWIDARKALNKTTEK